LTPIAVIAWYMIIVIALLASTALQIKVYVFSYLQMLNSDLCSGIHFSVSSFPSKLILQQVRPVASKNTYTVASICSADAEN
jgi:hypothetical protein